MKTYSERTVSILDKAKVQRKKRNTIRIAVGSVLSLALLLSGITLFTPYDTTPPSMEQYAASDYYSIIKKINVLTYQAPVYNNAFEEYVLDGLKGSIKDAVGGMTNGVDADFAPEQSVEDEMGLSTQVNSGATTDSPDGERYEEVTDNQVAGVIESDIIKRSDKYIYYLRNGNLSVYSIAGADSKEVGSFEITDTDGYKIGAYGEGWEMFLSSDCETITLISSAYNNDTTSANVVLISLDVSDPAKITERQRSYLTGEYLSARMVNDELLVMAHYNANWHKIDFADETTFVPQYGTPENMKCIEAENIVSPDTLTTTDYTVICKLDGTTLEEKSTGAFLSYSDEVYVSADNVYATRTYTDKYVDNEGITHVERMTEISALSYSGEELSYVGSTSVAGSIENQYYLDEYNGILRVVTTTNTDAYIEHIEERGDISSSWIVNYSSTTNASLYCIDLDTWEVVASVESFAPAGETVESVRFDGNYAYVCTAVVITMTDPVFYFDLSDLNNITYKDTGDIEGYSSSLVNFGDYLLGIGYGDSSDTLKIEMYQETETGVESVCAYEVFNCNFSKEYKSYLIDRKNLRVGLGYGAYDEYSGYNNYYVLLQFDGYNLFEYIKVDLSGNNANKRAVIIDNYIYMFGDDYINNFVVKEL